MRKKFKKRLLGIILTILMVVSVIPVTVTDVEFGLYILMAK